MTQNAYDVTTIGNALVDIIIDTGDDFLIKNAIEKGAMTLIDTARAELLSAAVGPALEMSGGSAANTAVGIASLGGRAAFMGKVRDDHFGMAFRSDLQSQGVRFATAPSIEGTPTGRCIVIVTPDAQRSMSTYLGAAVEFAPEDIDEALLAQSKITYLEGYLFDPPNAQRAFRKAAGIVHATGNKLALTLSDTFCVERHRDAFLDLVKNEVDILFANQYELTALYQTGDLNAAVETARAHCSIVVATCSEKGAIVTMGTETVEVPAVAVKKAVDSTGAGDLFAAGFLYGITNGKNIPEAGHIGAIAAAEIISHYGPRPQVKLSTLL